MLSSKSFAGISPYAEYRRMPEESSPQPPVSIDDTTGENIYEEIFDQLNTSSKAECTYENII